MLVLKVTDEINGFHLGPEALLLVGPRIGTWHETRRYPHYVMKVSIWLTPAL